MTDDRRSIREIEADLERHRAELTYNIDLLQSKLSVDGAVRQIKQLAGDNLSDVSAGISRMAVRGFSASKLASSQRLKAIAALLAKTIQSTTRMNKSQGLSISIPSDFLIKLASCCFISASTG